MTKVSRKLTDITDARASEFLKTAKLRERLPCGRISGFYLIKLAKGGAWRYRYTDPAGKRREATIGKFANYKPQAAAAVAHQWTTNKTDPLAESDDRKLVALTAAETKERRTLRYYLDKHYLPHMERSWKPDNAKLNYGRITCHFNPLLDRDMVTICKADVDDWQRKAEKIGRTYATIRRTYSSLKTLIRQAVKDGVLDSDPLQHHKLLEPTRKDQKAAIDDPSKSERRMLTNIEIAAIHAGLDLFAEEIRAQRRRSRKHGKPDLPDLEQAYSPHWFIPFCHLALHTGLRPGDLYSLTWQELSITFGRLTKVCEKTAHAARRDKKPAVVDMKLNATIKDIMAGWQEDSGQPKTGLVFPSVRTGKQFDKSAHRKPWKRVKELGGLPEGLNFYALRHHFISALLANGVPVFTVAKLVGHKSSEMIEEHYGHLCQDKAAEAVDIVAQSLQPKQKLSVNHE